MKLIILDKNWNDQEKELLKQYEFSNESRPDAYSFCKEDSVFILPPSNKNETIKIDFLRGDFLFRLKTLGRGQSLFRALNIPENKKIFDATAGLGKDAISFCFFGCHVTACEQNPVIYLMLQDAIRRAFQSGEFRRKIKGEINLIYGNAIDILSQNTEIYESIYIDPMYPQTEEKTSKSKKDISFLQEFLPATQNIEELLALSLSRAQNRVVVKRPPLGEFILRKPNHSFESKMVRFDMYLCQSGKLE